MSSPAGSSLTLTSVQGKAITFEEIESFSYLASFSFAPSEKPHILVHTSTHGHLVECENEAMLTNTVQTLFATSKFCTDRFNANFFLEKTDQDPVLYRGQVQIQFLDRTTKIQRFLDSSGLFFPACGWKTENFQGPSLNFVTNFAAKEKIASIVSQALTSLKKYFRNCFTQEMRERTIQYSGPADDDRKSEEVPTQKLSQSPIFSNAS